MASNNSIYFETQNDEYTRKHLPALAFIAIIIILGIIGNVIVSYVYLTRFKPTTTRCFIVVTALLDIFNCLVIMPMKLYELRHFLTFGKSVMCWTSAMLALFVTASVFLVHLLIAVDRYIKICRPYEKQMTVFTARMACVIVLSVTFLSTLPVPVIRGARTIIINNNINGSICWYPDQQTRWLQLAFTGFHTLLFISTMVTLLVIYICIWRRVYKQNKLMKHTDKKCNISISTNDTNVDGNCISMTLPSSVDGNTDLGEGISITESEQRDVSKSVSGFCDTRERVQSRAIINVTLTMCIVTFVSFISIIPYVTVSALVITNENFIDQLSDFSYGILTVCLKSYLLHSAMNPIIYSVFSAGFRRQVGLSCKET